MTNIELLEQKIADSGLKKSFIAKQLGITLQGFLNKLSNKSEFKVAEAIKLKNLLRLTQQEFIDIFYAKNVDK